MEQPAVRLLTRAQANPARRACLNDVTVPLPPDHVYIGRGSKLKGLRKSQWHNPFHVRDDRTKCLRKYEAHLNTDEQLQAQLETLRDKTLVCHRKDDQPCHADIIIEHLKKGPAHPPPEQPRTPSGGQTEGPSGNRKGLPQQVKRALDRLWSDDCPIPPHVWARVVPTKPEGYQPPLKTPEFVILHLYAGADDAHSLGHVLQDMAPRLAAMLVELDVKRHATRHDMLNDHLYYQLYDMARQGHVIAVLGGPNCRTWTILRVIKPMPQSPQLRGYEAKHLWGLPKVVNPDGSLPSKEVEKCDVDSILMLRFLLLARIAKETAQAPHLLEHPAEPEVEGPTVWRTTQYLNFHEDYATNKITFDECRLGQLVAKPTTIDTDLPGLEAWQDLRCNHVAHPHIDSTEELSRWPRDMMQGIATALVRSLANRAPGQQPLTLDQQTRLSQGHKVTTTETFPAPPPIRAKARMPPPPPPPPAPRAAAGAVGGHEGGAAVGTDMPVTLREDAKVRILRDGGGLKSPGTRMPRKRGKAKLASLGATISALAGNFKATQALELLCHTKQKASPFPPDLLRQTREAIADHIGMPRATAEHVHRDQCFHLDLISALAKHTGDTDWFYPMQIAEGVPLGVDEDIEPTQGIWPDIEHRKPRPDTKPHSAENYPSAEEHAEIVKETYLADLAMGHVAGPFRTRQEAADCCGCTEAEICLGGLGAKDEGDKVRTIHDGTVNNVNPWIQHHMHQKTTVPLPTDLLYTLALAAQDGIKLTTLKTDVSKAHRRVKLLRKDWKYTAAEIEGDIYVNKCGTYGVASAQWYWGRMAALLLRLTYEILDGTYWHFVYVDDYIFLIRVDGHGRIATVILLLLEALGTPLAWHKTHLGEINTWLGFLINATTTTIQVSHPKLPALVVLLEKLYGGERHTGKHIEHMVGLLNWATMAYRPVKPLLFFFYRWLRVTVHATHPPIKVRALAAIISRVITADPFSHYYTWQDSKGTGATDAGAKLGKNPTVGGWWCADGIPDKTTAIWFAEELTPEQIPWAWGKGGPQAFIGALELIAISGLHKIILDEPDAPRPGTRLDLVTDNRGDSFSVIKNLSKSWETAAVLSDMAVLAGQTHTLYAAKHRHREYNTWADALTNSEFDGFTANNRRRMNIMAPAWELARWLLSLHGVQQLGPRLRDREPHQADSPGPLLAAAGAVGVARGERPNTKRARHRPYRNLGPNA